MASAGRAVDTQKIKMQMNDAGKTPAGACGPSLVQAFMMSPRILLSFVWAAKPLYDGIAAVDAERASLQAQLDELERQAQQAAQAATTFACPFCGARMGVSDLFCSGCGKPIAEIKDAFAAQQQAEAPVASAGGPVCPACGAPVVESDCFAACRAARSLAKTPLQSNATYGRDKNLRRFCPAFFAL